MAAQLTDPAFLGLAEGATAHWLDYGWVYAFAAAIGFGTTIAEPSLMAVAHKAAAVSGGTIRPWGLRIAVAIGVAVGVGLGAVRIVTGLPLHYLFMSAYAIVIVLTIFASRSIIALAYDSGGVTSSTVTVPLVAALGLGLAANVPGRSPMLDGFGLIAFACVFAVIAVLGYAQLSSALQAARKRRSSGKGA
ncbi:Na(+), Li(+), K(+)/H(+) antiporter subunit B [Geodia barretti]|uniref:Na(+), Li(+), K(+)/H(+) antiporter subunit B n=1 Tax=Geodia barretti TaxID=519541 RepID=A0AA35X4A5_GEOBA|nr:Na(+), Li(+), K(+)/H(+) antiporter subunit B [Geodia barretti]